MNAMDDLVSYIANTEEGQQLIDAAVLGNDFEISDAAENYGVTAKELNRAISAAIRLQD